MADLNINIKVTSRALRWAALGLLLCAGVTELGSESLTLSTYYPAPSGVYNKMVTTGDTFLARDPGGKVSIGAGNLLQVGTAASDPPDGTEGAIYYNTASHSFLGFQNGRWASLGGTSAASGVGNGAQMFTSDGDFTVPSGVTKLRVEVYGGGGAGGGSGFSNAGMGGAWNYTAGGGGGGGGVAIKYVTVTPGTVVHVTVGSNGGNSNYGGWGGGGGSGGTSSFGSYVSATGGAGGSNSGGGAGGTGSGGDIVLTGGAGTAASGNGGGTGGAAGNGGVGNANPYGFGGSGGAGGSASAGFNGGTFGGGGGGGCGGSYTDCRAGSGGAGAVFVLW